MPNQLKESLGEKGKMLTDFSQTFTTKRAFIDNGACTAICAKYMSSILDVKMPSERDYLETGQWIYENPLEFDKRIDLLAANSGLRNIDKQKGRLLTDELYLTLFLGKTKSQMTFNLFSFWDTPRNVGHTLLLFTLGDEAWSLLDPNYGIAEWPHLGAMLVGMKKLIKEKAYSDMGPFFPFDVIKYGR